MALEQATPQKRKITLLCSTIKMKFKNPNKNNAIVILKELLVEKGVFSDEEFIKKVKEKHGNSEKE